MVFAGTKIEDAITQASRSQTNNYEYSTQREDGLGTCA